MIEALSLAAKITSVISDAVIGILLEHSVGIAGTKAGKKLLARKIRKRELYLKRKYENRFTFLDQMDTDSFYDWLKERRTIERILSFSNAEDIGKISPEQMRFSKECFFTDAFRMAQTHDLHEKEELRKALNELFQYVDELFWKELGEKGVFLYNKCVSEVKQSVRELAEEVAREIRYHGSFAEYIDNQKVLQKVPFKLDYRSEEISFFGRTKELKELAIFCDSGEQISWWAVIGRGGSGKSRLAYQFIKNNMGSSEWKMLFLHDEFFSQANGGGKYKNWSNWTYDKNLLVVVDYVQKFAKEVSQWIEGLAFNHSVTRKIRVLLLERTDGENAPWMKEGFEKPLLSSLKYAKSFLRLQSMNNDLISFVMQYAGENHKQIREADAEDARDKLKTIDADTRILYFIMILEAVLNNEPWRRWNRVEITDYIVKREQEDIAARFRNNGDMIRSYYILLAFCTATGELPFFKTPPRLPKLIIEEIEKIRSSSLGRDELCAVMQLEDGCLQPFTPDIIGEYMVLSVLKQYLYDSGQSEAFIRDLWIYDPKNFIFFVYRLFEDHINGGAFDSIISVMLVDAVPYDMIAVRDAYATLLWCLTGLGDLRKCLFYVKMLEKLYHNDPDNRMLARLYAQGLVNLSSEQELHDRKGTVEKLSALALEKVENQEIQILYAKGLYNLSYEQELPDRKETVERLSALALKKAENEEIQTIYAKALSNLSSKQELLDRKETVERLSELAAEKAENEEIQTFYAKGLFHLSSKQELPEKKETIEKLSKLAVQHVENKEIQIRYAGGLYNLSNAQELPEKEETIEKLSKLAVQHAENKEIQTDYAKGLVNLSNKQELPEKKETIERLSELAAEKAENEEIQTVYAKGLFNLSCDQELPEKKESIERLSKLAAEKADNEEIQTKYAKGLFNLSSKQELPEKKESIERLSELAAEKTKNGEIQTIYAKGLFHLSNKQELPEKKETIERLSELAAEKAENEEIQTVYAKGLFNLSNDQELLKKKETIERLSKLAVGHAENKEIQIRYAKGLVNLSNEQKLPERKETIERLSKLAVQHAENKEIQILYAKGLVNLSNEQKLPERKETIERLSKLAVQHAENEEIQLIYAKCCALMRW